MNFLFKNIISMYFIMKISDMCLKKNLNFKMCRNWRKTENVEWVGICADIASALGICADITNWS